jgi:hypothetical protein
MAARGESESERSLYKRAVRQAAAVSFFRRLLRWVRKGERPGQRSVPIGFRELHLPTCPVEERHERPDGYRLMGAGIGEYKENTFKGLRGLDGPSVAEQKALAGN